MTVTYTRTRLCLFVCLLALLLAFAFMAGYYRAACRAMDYNRGTRTIPYSCAMCYELWPDWVCWVRGC